jgi:lipid-A-disaccharide synthase
MAGEASGDTIGGRLMAALAAARPGLSFAGIGGARMEARGLRSLFPMSDLAVMGLMEVLPRVRLLRRRVHEAAADILARKPDIVVSIDAPGFMLHVLKRVAASGVKRIHYVAPQVWAWREHRVKSFPGLWDELLCLLPFEVGYFAGHGLPVRFVGHPVLESGAGAGDGSAFRARHGIADDAPVLVLMPGSRRSEAPRLLPVFGETLTLLARDVPALVPVIPVSAAVSEIVQRGTASWPVRPVIVTDLADKHDAYAAASGALTKSGTSTLELALAGVPMAVTYRVNAVSAWMARRMIRVKHVAMVNLLAGRAVVPELLQQDCRPGRLAAVVRQMLDDPAMAAAQRAAFGAVLDGLHPPGETPSAAAAREVLALLDRATREDRGG